MTSVDDLLREIQGAVRSRTMSYTSASASNDVYEGYVFSLIVRAAKVAGASVEYRDVHGNRTNNLVFRTGPGLLYSTKHAYSHAVLNFQDCNPLEVHIGVKVQGKSGVLHECDVLVLPKSEADLSRLRQVAPRGSRSTLAVECKFYAASLGLYLGRSFLGLHSDLGVKNSFFVSNISARSLEKLFTYHNRGWEHDVVPSRTEADFFVGQVRKVFRSYKSANGN